MPDETLTPAAVEADEPSPAAEPDTNAVIVEETLRDSTPVEAPPAADEDGDTPAAPAAEEVAPAEAAVEEPPGHEPPTDVAAAADAEPPPETKKRWYVVKVQSGREDTIKDAIERKVKIEGLEEFFGQIVIPTEKVTEVKKGKRVVKEKKLYAGYIMAEVEYNDRILYLFRETSGVGDFVGGTITRPPPPMTEREVAKMIGKTPDKDDPKEAPAKSPYEKGDRVKVKDGIFKDMDGEVIEVLEGKGQVRVQLTIFGRPTSVEMEYWQVEHL